MPPLHPTPRQIAHDDDRLSQRTVWADTEPAALDLLPCGPTPTRPGHEALQGLQVRELHSSALFHRYFGDCACRVAESASTP